MATFVIITIIVILLVVILSFIDLPKKKHTKTLYDTIVATEYYKKNKENYDIQKISMGSKGTDSDVMPEGIGEFGLEVTNPIPTSTVYGSIYYLGCLRTIDDIKVKYERKGSTTAPNIPSMIDVYSISANSSEIAILYICPYNQKNSERAPKGFKLSALPFV